jgi:LDH2 family malate/lactate/ureidoglycolate dehydrogenase
MIRKSPQELHDLVQAILAAAGASEAHAETVAEHLVAAEVAGVETHGLRPIWVYFRDIRNGQLLPAAPPEILKETDSSALISGGWTFGHVAAKYGMEVAIEKASASNIAIVSLVQLHHIGRVGHYAEMAAKAGMVGIITGAGYCRPAGRTAPYGGREKILDTNPISMGFPNPEEPDQRPVLLDYATTFRAQGALYLAQLRGQELPPGFVIDRDGNPSTDPNELDNGGAMLPFGTYKGYALMMAVEYLARICSGSDDHIEAQHGSDMFRHQGVTMIVFKADLFRSMEEYAQSAREMSRTARAVAPAPGFDAVRMPGDPEADARAERLQEGIPVADDIWQMVVEEATTLGVSVGP